MQQLFNNLKILNKHYQPMHRLNLLHNQVNYLSDCNLVYCIHHSTIYNNLIINIIHQENQNINIYYQAGAEQIHGKHTPVEFVFQIQQCVWKVRNQQS
ncbi:unnamed protein product [Paramecium pentaurelia]|uniref:Uncharacterized protein n=1 Tax=Paramecium pentaurelia TaxID=43138 RepID=A0A8S1TED8_9CILI|nr:unnamed protein product [Paramecium pentaurelia]